MIEFVNVVNLKRRLDKLIGYYGMMQSRSVPRDKIIPFAAYDAADYPDGFAIRDAAQKEFPSWKNMPDRQARIAGRGDLCCIWSFQSVINRIAQGDSMQLFTTDHYCITWDWWDLRNFMRKLPEFDIFQMEHWGSLKNGNLAPGFPRPLLDFPEISEGLAGAGDAVLALTPKGAGRILDWWFETPRLFLLERLLYRKSHEQLGKCLSPVVSRDFVWGPLKLDHLTGKTNSERTAIQ